MIGDVIKIRAERGGGETTRGNREDRKLKGDHNRGPQQVIMKGPNIESGAAASEALPSEYMYATNHKEPEARASGAAAPNRGGEK